MKPLEKISGSISEKNIEIIPAGNLEIPENLSGGNSKAIHGVNSEKKNHGSCSEGILREMPAWNSKRVSNRTSGAISDEFMEYFVKQFLQDFLDFFENFREEFILENFRLNHWKVLEGTRGRISGRIF